MLGWITDLLVGDETIVFNRTIGTRVGKGHRTDDSAVPGHGKEMFATYGRSPKAVAHMVTLGYALVQWLDSGRLN